MKLEFSKEQIQVLYELIGRSQITGQAAKMVAGIQSVIEEAIKQDVPQQEEQPKK